MSAQLGIVPLSPDLWSVLKELRIAALTESPDAFSPTADDARARDDAYWRSGAERMSSEDARMFFARWETCWIGLVSATRDANDVGHIGAMWVHPEFRRYRVGARLLDRALEFLDRQCSVIELSVTEGNERAIALYQSRGFALTGDWTALRESSPLKNLIMRRRR